METQKVVKLRKTIEPKIPLEQIISPPPSNEIVSTGGFGAQPFPLEVTVSYSGSVKVAIEEYGKKSADASVFVSRKYAVPSDWNEEQLRTFEMSKALDLKDEIDPILQQEHDNFMAQRTFK